MGRDNYGKILSAGWDERRGELCQVSLASAKRGVKFNIRARNWLSSHIYWAQHFFDMCTLRMCTCAKTQMKKNSLWVSLVLLVTTWLWRNLQTLSTSNTRKCTETVKMVNWLKGNSSCCFAATKVVVAEKITITPRQVPAEFRRTEKKGGSISSYVYFFV